MSGKGHDIRTIPSPYFKFTRNEPLHHVSFIFRSTGTSGESTYPYSGFKNHEPDSDAYLCLSEKVDGRGMDVDHGHCVHDSGREKHLSSHILRISSYRKL